MSTDIKEVIQEVSFFLRFDLRKRGTVIDARPSESGWEVQAELLDPRPDLSSSYKKVYDQNIYRIDVGPELSILACEKIGERQKDGHIRFFPRQPPVRRLPPPKPLARLSEAPRNAKVSLDPSFVGNLAEEISRKVSSALQRGKGSGLEEEIVPKGAFIDPYEQVDLDYNFKRVGTVEQHAEGNLPAAVERLKKMTSARKKKAKRGS